MDHFTGEQSVLCEGVLIRFHYRIECFAYSSLFSVGRIKYNVCLFGTPFLDVTFIIPIKESSILKDYAKFVFIIINNVSFKMVVMYYSSELNSPARPTAHKPVLMSPMPNLVTNQYQHLTSHKLPGVNMSVHYLL